MDQKKKKGLALFPRLLIATLGIGVLISGMLTSVYYFYNKRSIEKRTIESVQQQFEAISYHFKTELRAALIKDLQLLSSNPSLDSLSGPSLSGREAAVRSMERFFFESLKFSRNYENISFLNAAGIEVVRVNWSGGVKTSRNLSRQAIFTRVREAPPGGIDVEGPFRDKNGTVQFTAGIYRAMPHGVAFGGVVMIDHNMTEFIDYLDKIRIFGENPLWVFMPDGEVLKQPVEKKATLDPRPFFKSGFQKETSLEMLPVGVVVYRDLYVNPDRPLLRLAISIPESLLLRDIQSVLRFFLIVSGASLVLISILAYYLAGYLSRPIVELASAASRLATGDLSTRVKGTATGEVQLLIESFNRMSVDLERTTVSKDYVDDILRSMMDTLIVVAPDRTIIRVNEAACALLEYGEAELVGRSIDMVMAPGQEQGMPVLDEVLQRGFIGTSERVYLTRSRKKVPVLFSASLMHDVQQEKRHIVCVAQDISDRKRDEEKLQAYSVELQEINDELKSLAYIISHDMRAPLVNIKGFSEELLFGIKELGPILERYLEGFPPGEREKFSDILKKDIPEAITYIGSSVNRMDTLINSILKLSRAGRRTVNPEGIGTHEMVQNIVRSLAHQIETGKVGVTVHPLPDVVSDRAALEQIFGNLLDNAIKYLDPERPGIIEISGERNFREVLFHVRDNGRGMTTEDIPKAFELFRRVGRQDVPGEGMGLAYVKTLVRLLGGRIWCESQPGVGTTFHLSLAQPEKPAA